MLRLRTPFPSGRLVAAVLIVSIAVWAVMVFGTLAHLRMLAGGLDPFDMRPTGYRHDEAVAFLTAIGSGGRDFYARVQLRIDAFYPALYAASRGLAIWWLTEADRIGSRPLPGAVRVLLIVPPLLAAAFDYRENAAISAMLAHGAAINAGMVADASLATQIKSVAGLVTEVTAIALAGIACFGWWRRRGTK